MRVKMRRGTQGGSISEFDVVRAGEKGHREQQDG